MTLLAIWVATITLLATTTSGQSGDWRIEKTTKIPALTYLKEINGTYVNLQYNGLYLFSPVDSTWRHVEVDLRYVNGLPEVRAQPDGSVLISYKGVGQYYVRRLNLQTGELGPRNSMTLDVIIDDTLSGEMFTRGYGDSMCIVGKWTSLTTNKVVWEDSLPKGIGAYPQVTFVRDDTTMVGISGNKSFLMPLRGKGTYSELPRSFTPGRPVIASSNGRNHLTKKEGHIVMYSRDGARTWTTIPTDNLFVYGAVMPCWEPDQLLVWNEGTLFRYDVATTERSVVVNKNTLAISPVHFVDGPLGVMISTADGMKLVGNDGVLSDVSTGLPSLGADDIHACPDGMIAALRNGQHARLESGRWSTVDMDYPELKNGAGSSWYSKTRLYGARSIRDYWFSKGWFLYNVIDDSALKLDSFRLYGGCVWLTERDLLVRHIQDTLGTMCLTQTSLNGSKEILFSNQNLAHFLTFEDGSMIAIEKYGAYYRSGNRYPTDWGYAGALGFELGQNFKSLVKGKHAVIVGQHYYAITHDAGRTWSAPADRSDIRDGVALTRHGELVTIRYNYSSSTLPEIVVYLIVDNSLEEIARTPIHYNVFTSYGAYSIAFNDVDQRLYLSNDSWIRSVGINVVSVEEQKRGSPRAHKSPLPHGVYDLQGRFVCDTPEEIPFSGFYIVVTEEGTTLRAY